MARPLSGTHHFFAVIRRFLLTFFLLRKSGIPRDKEESSCAAAHAKASSRGNDIKSHDFSLRDFYSEKASLSEAASSINPLFFSM